MAEGAYGPNVGSAENFGYAGQTAVESDLLHSRLGH